MNNAEHLPLLIVIAGPNGSGKTSHLNFLNMNGLKL